MCCCPTDVPSDLLRTWPLIAGHSGSNSVMEWLTSAARTSTDQRTCELDRVTAEENIEKDGYKQKHNGPWEKHFVNKPRKNPGV